MAEFLKVCVLSDISPGTMYPVDIGELHIMVINLDGKLYAVDRMCTHETADLSAGFLIDSEVTCPLHLSRFDVTNGSVKNPPATKPLRTYEVKTEGSNVYVRT